MSDNGIHVTAEVDASSSAPMGVPMVMTEADADAMLLQQFGNDPVKLRLAADELWKKMKGMADEIDGGKSAQEAVIAISAPPPPAGAVNLPHVTPAPKPQHQTQHQTVAGPADVPAALIPLPIPNPPTGYMPVPEGLYHWTPETWGERPLHAVPKQCIEKHGRPTLLIFVLLAPAFARDRAGRVVSLPQGAHVVVHAGVAWSPVIPLAKDMTGRPVLWAVPSGIRYETGDGGFEHGIVITYDPDPHDPNRPRMISIETLTGVRPEAAE